jgi:hypothetical protein
MFGNLTELVFPFYLHRRHNAAIRPKVKQWDCQKDTGLMPKCHGGNLQIKFEICALTPPSLRQSNPAARRFNWNWDVSFASEFEPETEAV